MRLRALIRRAAGSRFAADRVRAADLRRPARRLHARRAAASAHCAGMACLVLPRPAQRERCAARRIVRAGLRRRDRSRFQFRRGHHRAASTQDRTSTHRNFARTRLSADGRRAVRIHASIPQRSAAAERIGAHRDRFADNGRRDGICAETIHSGSGGRSVGRADSQRRRRPADKFGRADCALSIS